jgi:hypothetical protein
MGVEKQEGKMQDGKITEEGLAKLRSLIGKKLRKEYEKIVLSKENS